MRASVFSAVLGSGVLASSYVFAGQAPGSATAPDIAISHHDRVYAAEQFSNTVSVTDPVDNKLLGVIRLGEPQPTNFSPLYHGQVLVHGMGFSPDRRTIAVVSIGSNAVIFSGRKYGLSARRYGVCSGGSRWSGGLRPVNATFGTTFCTVVV